MQSKDFDGENEVGILRSGKRYKLEETKRNVDGDWNNYLESTSDTSLWCDSEGHNNRIKTPEKLKTLEVKLVTPPISGNNTKNTSQ